MPLRFEQQTNSGCQQSLSGNLRRTFASLSGRGSFYYFNDFDHYSQGIIVNKREFAAESLMIFMNFSGQPGDAWVQFPKAGRLKQSQISHSRSLIVAILRRGMFLVLYQLIIVTYVILS